MRGYGGGIWHKSNTEPGRIIVSTVTQAMGRGIEGPSIHLGPIWFRIICK